MFGSKSTPTETVVREVVYYTNDEKDVKIGGRWKDKVKKGKSVDTKFSIWLRMGEQFGQQMSDVRSDHHV